MSVEQFQEEAMGTTAWADKDQEFFNSVVEDFYNGATVQFEAIKDEAPAVAEPIQESLFDAALQPRADITQPLPVVKAEVAAEPKAAKTVEVEPATEVEKPAVKVTRGERRSTGKSETPIAVANGRFEYIDNKLRFVADKPEKVKATWAERRQKITAIGVAVGAAALAAYGAVTTGGAGISANKEASVGTAAFAKEMKGNPVTAGKLIETRIGLPVVTREQAAAVGQTAVGDIAKTIEATKTDLTPATALKPEALPSAAALAQDKPAPAAVVSAPNLAPAPAAATPNKAPVPAAITNTKPTPEQVKGPIANPRPTSLKKILQMAGFTGRDLQTAYGVALAESGGNSHAHNPNVKTGDNSYGLFQINMLGSMGPARRKMFGLKSNDELFDPVVNARVARQMSRGGWGPWSTFKNGAYKRHAGDSGDIQVK